MLQEGWAAMLRVGLVCDQCSPSGTYTTEISLVLSQQSLRMVFPGLDTGKKDDTTVKQKGHSFNLPRAPGGWGRIEEIPS